MPKMNHKGQTSLPILILLAFAGVIAYLVITSSFSFNNGLLGVIYKKNPSQAFEGTKNASQGLSVPVTSVWQENWENTELFVNWDKLVFNCSSYSGSLILNCQNIEILSKISWSKNSPVILTGSYSKQNNNSTASIGFSEIGMSKPYFEIHADSGSDLQKFKLALTPINNEYYVYYYQGDNPKPVDKTRIFPSEKLRIFLSCTGECKFSPLIVSGLKNDPD